MNQTTIADRLRYLRRKANYATAAEFARAYGLNATTYRAHENGTRDVPREAAIRYSRIFGGDALGFLLMGGAEPGVTIQAAAKDKPIAAKADQGAGELYDRAVKTVRIVLQAAGIADRDREAKAVAELYHALLSSED